MSAPTSSRRSPSAASPVEAAGRLTVSSGPWAPDPGQTAAYWIVAGLLQREIALHRSIAVDLLGPQDLVVCGGDEEPLLAARVSFSALTELDVIALDERRLAQLQRRPEVVAGLLAHAGAQYRRMALHRAVAQLPRVEDRLLALFWLLAERWGRVASEGVVVPLKLGHEVLGRMVGARRPTITLALKGLSESGRLTRRRDGTWRLDPTGQPQLADSIQAPPLQAYLLDQPADLRAPDATTDGPGPF